MAKVHGYIIAELKRRLPWTYKTDKIRKHCINQLGNIYEKLQQEHKIDPNDFPDIDKMKKKLEVFEYRFFKGIKPSLFKAVDDMLDNDITRLKA